MKNLLTAPLFKYSPQIPPRVLDEIAKRLQGRWKVAWYEEQLSRQWVIEIEDRSGIRIKMVLDDYFLTNAKTDDVLERVFNLYGQAVADELRQYARFNMKQYYHNNHIHMGNHNTGSGLYNATLKYTNITPAPSFLNKDTEPEVEETYEAQLIGTTVYEGKWDEGVVYTAESLQEVVDALEQNPPVPAKGHTATISRFTWEEEEYEQDGKVVIDAYEKYDDFEIYGTPESWGIDWHDAAGNEVRLDEAA